MKKAFKKYAAIFALGFILAGYWIGFMSASLPPKPGKLYCPAIYGQVGKALNTDSLPNGVYYLKIEKNKPVKFIINEP